jgi:hypothetical protein
MEGQEGGMSMTIKDIIADLEKHLAILESEAKKAPLNEYTKGYKASIEEILDSLREI